MNLLVCHLVVQLTTSFKWHLLTGKSLEHDDPRLLNLLKMFDDAMADKNNPFLFFGIHDKWIMNFIKIFKLCQLPNSMEKILQFTKDTINEHIKLESREETEPSFIQQYLHKIKNTSQINNSFYGNIGRLNLENAILDFFMAGSETVSSYLNWCTLFMAKYRDVQKKVQEELDSISEGSRLIDVSDKVNTPYTEAVMLEVARMSNLFSGTDQRNCNKDLNLGKYDIKDILILEN